MALNSRCPAHQMNAGTWATMRDVVGGEDLMKMHCRRYIPQGSMDDGSYMDMVARAEFFPAAARTLDGIHGLMFCKPPIMTGLDGYSEYADNVDGCGSTLSEFMSDAAKDMMTTGWGGVLVDAPDTSGLSAKDAEEGKLFPYCKFYRAEDIFNLQTKTVGRREVITLVVLHEVELVKSADDYTLEPKDRYRELTLDEGGLYVNRLYDETLTLKSEAKPAKDGKRIGYIPFFPISLHPKKPMIKDVALANITNFRLTADYLNGLHCTAQPTPYVIGYVPEVETIEREDGTTEERAKEPLRLGCRNIIYFPEGTTAVGYLEFSGSGLSQLAAAIDRSEDRMAILGARIISAEKRGVESAEAARIHRAGENSVAAAFANLLSKYFTAVAREYIGWCGAKETDGMSVSVNTDFDLSRMDASEIAALVSCWQQGGISKSVLFHNLKEGEVIPEGTTFDDMEDEIERGGMRTV